MQAKPRGCQYENVDVYKTTIPLQDPRKKLSHLSSLNAVDISAPKTEGFRQYRSHYPAYVST